MARRKKEPQNVHRKNIAMAAESLFREKGIENTSMNDIAKEAGYSKATLYVYFKDKEELISVLVLESMQKLYEYISKALVNGDSVETRYKNICWALVKYQEDYPLYFGMVLKSIRIDFETTQFLPEEKETFLVGERINKVLYDFFAEAIEKGEIRAELDIYVIIFSMWGMLAGVIQLWENKQEYLNQQTNKTKKEFLEYSFDLLYASIKR